MCQSDHPDIIRLEEVYESDTQIYLILALLTGGGVFDRLEQQPDFCFSETQCIKYVNQMMDAVRYLHSKKVVHRDLKIGKILVEMVSFLVSFSYFLYASNGPVLIAGHSIDHIECEDGQVF